MFEGAYTAIITPFGRDGSVDYGKLRDLIERQIAGGVDGIVPVGTTGESPTLDFEEHEKVIETCIEAAREAHQGHRRHGRQLHRRGAGADAPRHQARAPTARSR